MAKAGKLRRVDLGELLVNRSDADLIRTIIPLLSGRLEQETPAVSEPFRPPRMGSLLVPGRFFAWAVRYAITRADRDHAGWHLRLRTPEDRKLILTGREVRLGACRVYESEATSFRLACQSFYRTLCARDERMNQSRFLTLSVVGFAECVKACANLHDLPSPPWLKYK